MNSKTGRLGQWSVHPEAGKGRRNRSIAHRMAWNNLRGTATSANWKVTRRAWRTAFAPILINFSRVVVNVQRLTSRGRTSCRRKFSEVVRQHEEVKLHLVVDEIMARQTRPLYRILAFLDPLLCRSPLVIEADDAFGRTREVCRDEANPGKQLAFVPFNLGNPPPGAVPPLGLVGKVGIPDKRRI